MPETDTPAPAGRRRAFPLVSRHRMTGVSYGSQRSLRRGQGAEVAGMRPYVPGDRLAWIDWYASARLSLVHDDDLFVVRQFYEEVAPRVIIVVDRRSSMALYPPELPWLAKPRAVREATTAIIAAAHAARAYVGYLEFVRHPGGEEAEPLWISPHRQSARRVGERLRSEFEAPENSFELAMDYLFTLHQDVPAGSFVFILSDFLRRLPDSIWSEARSRNWDVIPVIVQDPVWEQSFPDVPRWLIPFRDPVTGELGTFRLTPAEVRERKEANEARLQGLIGQFTRLRFDPVLLDTSVPHEVDLAFIRWATRRRVGRGRA